MVLCQRRSWSVLRVAMIGIDQKDTEMGILNFQSHQDSNYRGIRILDNQVIEVSWSHKDRSFWKKHCKFGIEYKTYLLYNNYLIY